MKPYFETYNGVLYHGDCLDIMPGLESCDMILTDPPYQVTACKWDIAIPFEPMWEQVNRLIKKNGAIVLFGSEPFSSVLRMSNIKNYKYDWKWLKTKPTGYQISKIKPLSKYEDIIIFGKLKLNYYPQMVERNKHKTMKVHRTNNQMKISGGGVYTAYKTYTHRYPVNVIEVSNGNQRNKQHPTQKPVSLMEYLIRTYTNPGETVLDFCSGSGTTAIAAENTGRKWVCIEKEEKYCEIAAKRIDDAEWSD